MQAILYQLITLFTQQKKTLKLSAIYSHSGAIVIFIQCNAIMPIVITRDNLVQNNVTKLHFSGCFCAISLTPVPIKNASTKNVEGIQLICARV